MTSDEENMTDQASLVRALAMYYGIQEDDLEAVRRVLDLPADDFTIRFTDLVRFAGDYGLDPKNLAEYVAANTRGIKRWESPKGPVEAAWAALLDSDHHEAESRAQEMLGTADTLGEDWDKGNRIHHAHLILGHIRLREGDMVGAERELLAAGRSPGSPQLDSFGPNMTLAKALLEREHRNAVIEYFRECASFWNKDPLSRLIEWQRIVQDGGIPDFGPNLDYGGSKGLTSDESLP
jgi:hypothetical protein